MKHIITFMKKETILTIAWVLTLITAFIIPPSRDYISYIDWRSLGILWGLMLIMAGFKENGFFDWIGTCLLSKTKRVGQLSFVLVFLCFFCSMLITNDVALITFVPFAIFMLEKCGQHKLLIPVIVLQTIAANLGSMLTPIGNPQCLYLYGISDLSLSDFILWMLPYTVLSGVLLLLCLLFMKGRKQTIQMKETLAGTETRKKKWLIYTILFALAILVVARILPYYLMLAAVLIVMVFIDRKVIGSIDYALLFTFIGFFLFTGNLSHIPSINQALTRMVSGHEILTGILASQCISNVPAALLLSGFSDNIKALLIGVNVGGLGTLIASMASLISYKSFAHNYNSEKGRYFLFFTIANVGFLAVLCIFIRIMMRQ